MNWSLGLSLGSQDASTFHAIEPGKNTYEWKVANGNVFCVSGYKRESTVVLSLWLVPDETSVGRLLCFTGKVPAIKLNFDYPQQMSVDCFQMKPRRNSLLFVNNTEQKKRTFEKKNEIELVTNAPELVSMTMLYQCRFSYKKSGCADMHAQLRVSSVTIELKDWGVLLEFLRHEAGHRIVLMCNETYLGGPQSITEKNSSDIPQESHRVYHWLPQNNKNHQVEKKFTPEETYDMAIIEGFGVVKSPRSSHDGAHNVALGMLLSPRAMPNNIKTPRPMSHVPKTDLTQPPFIPDSVEKKNPIKRLPPELSENNNLLFKVFNFRFTPPRYIEHRVQWNDFDAAYNRTRARSRIAAATLAVVGKVEKRKSFSQKKKAKKREKEEQMIQAKLDAELVCRLERNIAPNIALVILFKKPSTEGILLEEVLLEVNNFQVALQMEK